VKSTARGGLIEFATHNKVYNVSLYQFGQ